MKLSDYIVHFFEKQGVKVIFGYIGGMITHLVDSISESKDIRFIQVYHEQTASIAAEGYSRESGNIGVAISTSGPGATNMVTGIADAYFDSIPVIYITGQVNVQEYKYDKQIRQQGFQETEITEIVKPITKYVAFIDQAESIRYELEKAYYLATAGRPGPVLLDIPMNIQRAEINPDKLIPFDPEPEPGFQLDLASVIPVIRESKRPMLLVGAGCKAVKKELNEFIKSTGIPVVTSLLGKGLVDETLSGFLGMIGSYGNRCANMAIAKADMLIALGTRLDVRQTGALIDEFLQSGKIIHVDIDIQELNNHRLNNRIKVHTDVVSFLSFMEDHDVSPELQTDWTDYLSLLKNKYNQDKEIERFIQNKSPYRFFQAVNQYSCDNSIFCVDIGQNQMWAAQTLLIKAKQKFITSGGLAPMGFSLPSAVGVAFANPDRKIWAINGDGGFHMAVQSLLLIKQYDLPIKVIVMNNQALGMITQFQQLYFNGKMQGTVREGGYHVPDIRLLSGSYGLKYYQLKETDLQNNVLLKEIFKQRNCIIEFHMDGLTTVSPKLEYNKPIGEPSPQLPDPDV